MEKDSNLDACLSVERNPPHLVHSMDQTEPWGTPVAGTRIHSQVRHPP